MNNWVPKNKTLRAAIVTAGFAVLLYVAGFVVVFLNIKRAENFYQNSESETARSEKIAAIKSVVEANKDSLSVVDSFFIKSGEEVGVIENIERVAKESGVEFSIVSIDESTKEENQFTESLRVKIEVSGSWRNVSVFLHQLERMPFGVILNKVDLNVSNEEGWFGVVEFDVFREK
jgi:Tfp pilus assembly protein PilO